MAASTTSLSSSNNPSICGQFVIITATVSPVPPETATPTGSIVFEVDGALAPPVTIDAAGRTTLELALLTGTHLIGATYSGDGTFDPSAAPPLTQIVHQAPSTPAVVSSPNPAVCCTPVTFTMAVTPDPRSNQLPTGSVTLSVDGVPGTPATLVGGSATVTESDLPPGTHAVTAGYSGDGCFLPASSSAVTQTVTPAASSTTVTTTPNPSVCCRPVTLTATVTAAAPGGCVPTGDVLFIVSNHGAALSAPLNAGGQASVTVGTLDTSPHSIIAFYGGDTCFTSSTSAPRSQTVTRGASATAVTSSPNPSAPGQPVTLTATVTGAPPAGCTPTGTVLFVISNDGPALTAALNAGGQASATVGGLTTGPHSVTASYSGDTCFTPSTAPPINQVVT